jgi:ribose/xylose/arabinose/galactoside ABC-type transport system permease subunit
MASTVERNRPALIAQFTWEGVLLLVTAAVVILVAIDVPQMFEGGRLLRSLVPFGLAASGFALSLRTATPNLAVPAFAGLAGPLAVERVSAGWSLPVALLVVVLAAFVAGAVLGAVVGLTALPAWAVTLVAGGFVSAVNVSRLRVNPRGLVEGPAGETTMLVWFVVFLVISLGGGALWLVPAICRTLSANRGADGAVGLRVLGGAFGLGVSSALAALGGVLLVSFLGAVLVVEPFEISVILGAALLGGVSIFGGRGGVAGTALALGLILVLRNWMGVHDAPTWQVYTLPAVAAAAGLLVGWVIELIGKAGGPSPADPPPAAPPSAGTALPDLAA